MSAVRVYNFGQFSAGFAVIYLFFGSCLSLCIVFFFGHSASITRWIFEETGILFVRDAVSEKFFDVASVCGE